MSGRAVEAKPAETPQRGSRHRLKLEVVGAEIWRNPPAAKDHIYTHPIQCQVGLPRKLTPEREFVRQCGAAWISVQAGYIDEGNGPVAQPLPYGPFPRMFLACLTTHVMRSNSRQIALGPSASGFLRGIGMGRDGRRHKELLSQIHSFVACRIQYGYRGRTYGGQPVEQFDAFVSDQNPRSRWPGVMTLSQSFFESLKEGAVPLDRRAMNALMGSGLKLDIYAWLAHRLFRLKQPYQMVRWRRLRDQFAHEYTGRNGAKDFREVFLSALGDVLIVYPAARVVPKRGGVLLYRSPPPIAPEMDLVREKPVDRSGYPREMAPRGAREIAPPPRVKSPPSSHVRSPPSITCSFAFSSTTR